MGCVTGMDEKYRYTWVTNNEAMDAQKKFGASRIGLKLPKGYIESFLG